MTSQSHPSHSAYRPLMYMVARTVALPHGYTLLIWATTMVMVGQHGLPDVASVFCMLIGACGAYVIAGGLGIGGKIKPPSQSTMRQTRMVKQPYMVATANFATLEAATGLCVLAAVTIPVIHIAWLVVGLIGTSVYLIGIAIQNQFVDHLLLEDTGSQE